MLSTRDMILVTFPISEAVVANMYRMNDIYTAHRLRTLAVSIFDDSAGAQDFVPHSLGLLSLIYLRRVTSYKSCFALYMDMTGGDLTIQWDPMKYSLPVVKWRTNAESTGFYYFRTLFKKVFAPCLLRSSKTELQ